MSSRVKFCDTCNNEVEVGLENVILKGEVKGDCYSYEGLGPCTECGHFIPDEEIDKHNQKVLHDTYREKNDIISLEKIQEIPEKYDIGKRPLSHLLEWGELTFTRYYNGDIPSKAYSQILNTIYEKPEKYLEILEKNQDLLAKKAFEKSKTATEKLLKNSSKITNVLNYILIKNNDITPLAIQKLLYYSEGFYHAFFETPLFNDDCYTTNKGLIYQNVYNKLINETHKIEEEITLTKTEKIIVDSVIKYIGCYSGQVLTNFTEKEQPYLTAINKCEETEKIQKQDIYNYFTAIKNKYNMLNVNDINYYIKDIFRNEN